MHELAVGQRQEKHQHHGKVHDEQDAHRLAVTKDEQREPVRLVRKSSARNNASRPRRLVLAKRRVARLSQGSQPQWSDEQPESTRGTEHHRKARRRVRSVPAKHAVIERRDRRGREAQPEAVERAVMKPPPPRHAHVQVRRAVAAAAVQVTKRQRVAHGGPTPVPGREHPREHRARIARLRSRARSQNIGHKSRVLLKLTGTKVVVVAECSGIDGMWGLREENYELSKGVGRKLGAELRKAGGDVIAGDCHLANGGILEETGRIPVHPLQVLARSYGIPEEPDR